SAAGVLFGGARRGGVRLPPIARRRLPRAGRAVRGRTSQKIPAPTGEPRNRFAGVAVPLQGGARTPSAWRRNGENPGAREFAAYFAGPEGARIVKKVGWI